ncbi:hypothetical protein D9615_003190 [Tricholomella constricta]|uniref:Transmembrane protein n=1 Tax=Tricholomella constricta TaxID=117010 RepID=A0A8H5HJU9_9AGAR|nr:hypothetical protein D9615_003190 [Tricholomella constricta]
MLPLALVVFVVLSSFVGKCGHPDIFFSNEARTFYLAGRDVFRSTMQRMLLGQTVHEIASSIRAQSEEKTCGASMAEHTTKFRELPGTLQTTSSVTMNQIYGVIGRPLESPLVITVISPPCQCHSTPMTLPESRFLPHLPMFLVALLFFTIVAEVYRLLRSFLKPSPPVRPPRDDETMNRRDGRPAVTSLQVFEILNASSPSVIPRAFQLALPESVNSPDRAISLGPAVVTVPGVSIPAAPIPAIVVTDPVPTASSSTSVSTCSTTSEAPDKPGSSSSTPRSKGKQRAGCSRVVRRQTSTRFRTAAEEHLKKLPVAEGAGVQACRTESSSQTTTRAFDGRRALSRTADDDNSSSVPIYVTPHRRRPGETALWRRSSASDLCATRVADEERGARAASASFDESSWAAEGPVCGVFRDRTNIAGPSRQVAEPEVC